MPTHDKPKFFTHPNPDVVLALEVGYDIEDGQRIPICDLIYYNGQYNASPMQKYTAVRNVSEAGGYAPTEVQSFSNPRRARQWLDEQRELDRDVEVDCDA